VAVAELELAEDGEAMTEGDREELRTREVDDDGEVDGEVDDKRRLDETVGELEEVGVGVTVGVGETTN
jgi:hypothetical protein